MTLLLDALFSSVAFGHMAVDLINGQRSVLLAYLSEPLGLTNATIGLVSTAYILSGSLGQPIFGYLADRYGPRWVISGGVLWMAVFFSMAILTPGTAGLALLVIAAIGSGAFHPAGAMQATLRGRTHFSGRETTAASYFFLFGQLGHFGGPLLAGQILDRVGSPGLLVFAVFALPVGLNAARQLRGTAPLKPAKSDAPNPAKPIARKGAVFILAFVLLTVFQSWAQQNVVTFTPKYLRDLGETARSYGFMTSLFMGGSAVGNLLGGSLADRYGKRLVTMIALGLATIPLLLIPVVGLSPWLYVLIPLAGALTGATFSVLVVLAQRLIPGGVGLASGLILGLMFSAGAIGAFVSGHVADWLGIQTVFYLSAGLAAAAAVLTLTLKKD